MVPPQQLRGIILVEQDRHLRDRVAGFRGMAAVVQANADDLLGFGDARTKLGLVLGDEIAVSRSVRPRLPDQPMKPGNVPMASEHVRDRRGHAFRKVLFRRHHIEDAAVGADSQAHAFGPAQGCEGQALG
jgi:hypothetical protein